MYSDKFLIDWLCFYPEWQWEKHLHYFLKDKKEVEKVLKRIRKKARECQHQSVNLQIEQT